MKFRPQDMRKVDIAQCVDRIDPQALLAKWHAPPGIRRHVRAWLRSGMMADATYTPTTAGTPQGGSVSPLLALIALHGMDEAITQVYPEARVMASADDCVVLHEERSGLVLQW
jgi:RNA-directed DNA polymerase